MHFIDKIQKNIYRCFNSAITLIVRTAITIQEKTKIPLNISVQFLKSISKETKAHIRYKIMNSNMGIIT